MPIREVDSQKKMDHKLVATSATKQKHSVTQTAKCPSNMRCVDCIRHLAWVSEIQHATILVEKNVADSAWFFGWGKVILGRAIKDRAAKVRDIYSSIDDQ